MRGIRIWHLAAVVLTVPLLAANAPSGCTGLFNPNFVAGVTGQSGASASSAAPDGFIVLSFFNYTGFSGTIGVTAVGNGRIASTNWTPWPLYPDKPFEFVWACNTWLYELDLLGGSLDIVDPTTGTVTPTPITYTGGPLGNSQAGDPLECGSLIKANVYLDNTGAPVMDVELVK